VATVPAGPEPTWGADVKGQATYAVEASDAAGRWSAPLTAEVRHVDELEAGAMMGLAPPENGIADVLVTGEAALPARLGEPKLTGALSAEAVATALDRRRASIAACVERRPERPASQGTLKFQVSPEGKVAGVEVVLTPDEEGIRQCLVKLLSLFRLPSAAGETRVEIPITVQAP
jgi:hypothetical protein